MHQGRFALLATIAARAGARYVYALEGNRDAYEHAAAFVKSEGLSDKIAVIFGYSANISLDSLREPSSNSGGGMSKWPGVELIIHELLGEIAGMEGAAFALADAHHRLIERDQTSVQQSSPFYPRLSIPFRARSYVAPTAFPPPSYWSKLDVPVIITPGTTFLKVWQFPTESLLSDPAADVECHVNINGMSKVEEGSILDQASRKCRNTRKGWGVFESLEFDRPETLNKNETVTLRFVVADRHSVYPSSKSDEANGAKLESKYHKSDGTLDGRARKELPFAGFVCYMDSELLGPNHADSDSVPEIDTLRDVTHWAQQLILFEPTVLYVGDAVILTVTVDNTCGIFTHYTFSAMLEPLGGEPTRDLGTVVLNEHF